MLTRRSAIQIGGMLALSRFGSATAQGATEPVLFIVGQSPGGSADVSARLVGQAMSSHTRFRVVVENRIGAGTLLAAQRVASAVPDGNTMFLATASYSTSAVLQKRLTFDPYGSLKGIAQISAIPYCMAVNRKLGASTLQELIQVLKANPDKYSYGTSGVGSQGHFSGELFKILTSTKMVAVPYAGIPPAVTDLLRGEVSVLFTDLLSMRSNLHSEQVKVLAVTGNQRSKVAPDVPTFIEQGLRDFEITSWGGLMVSAGTPAEKIHERNQAVNAALQDPAVQEKLTSLGASVVGGTPDAFETMLRKERETYERIAKEARIALP